MASKVVEDLKGAWSFLTAEEKKVVAALAASEGPAVRKLMAAHPVYYTLGSSGVGALIFEALRMLIGHP